MVENYGSKASMLRFVQIERFCAYTPDVVYGVLEKFRSCLVEMLRYFKEDYPELHVVAAGSLLEFAL